MNFVVDSRIESSCIHLGDTGLSKIYLKNNQLYPWLILVPQFVDIQDIDQLPTALRHQLIDEISAVSSMMKQYFKPDKLNVGTLGNLVSQLHLHVIARFKTDALWPQGIWQAAQQEIAYPEEILNQLVQDLKHQLFVSEKGVIKNAVFIS